MNGAAKLAASLSLSLSLSRRQDNDPRSDGGRTEARRMGGRVANRLHHILMSSAGKQSAAQRNWMLVIAAHIP